jgi:hypothetical protein
MTRSHLIKKLAISVYNKQMKTLSKIHFPLNEAIFEKQDLLKLPNTDYLICLITLSVIPHSRAHLSPWRKRFNYIKLIILSD